MSVFRKSNNKVSSRRQIQIRGVQDGVLELPGKQYRMILEASSLNFELKSDAEQDAIIEGYQSFLNALPSAVQIVTRIRMMDMERYLEDFRQASSHESGAIYREQITAYADFVQSLITSNKILSRRFYVVIAFAGPSTDIATAQEHLRLNGDIVSKGLSRLKIMTRTLSSLEILDLFYSFYSPVQAKRQPVTEQTMQLLNTHYTRSAK